MKKAIILIVGWPLALACSAGIGDPPNPGSPTSGGSGGGATGSNGGAGGGVATGAGGGAAPGAGGSSSVGASGLPCDLASMLATRCQQCHGNPPSGGAPLPLVTYDDLVAPARTDPSRQAAQVALSRMQDAARPMPPAPAASASSAEIALLANWLSAGEPHGTCSMGPSGGGAGGAGGAPSTAPDAGSIPSTGASGLPCDVQAVLRSRCQTCHSNPPVGGAVGSLMTLADLTAPSRSNPAQSVGQRAVTRMQDNAAPMPPAPATRATTAEVATVQAWVSAGMPAGTCADAGAPPDAGNPFGTPPTCTSGRTSTVQEGATMDPGMPCVSCHAANSEAPKFSIGGTLYPTAHEPNNCIGTPGGTAGTASVVIVDANNQTLTLAVNAAGNFYSSTAVALPYHAKVVVGTSERVMVAAQTTGDCNSCHTQNGANSAPGRIILP